ncbi:hypothetical protein MMC31_007040, partial [Peltigera leucophlebia]|nr:hypothetical protein [Peltigera leucophlebia]
MPANPTLESAILANDLPACSLLTSPTTSTTDPLHALSLSARLSRPLAFAHLLTLHPSLTDSLNTEPFLLAALTGGSVPIWRIILAHEPTAKDRRFGHYGTVVERCVMGKKKELLEYLLGEGARVERPILLRAKACGASEEIRELLVRYGATTDLPDDEVAEGRGEASAAEKQGG